jgi:hypothetical protein
MFSTSHAVVADLNFGKLIHLRRLTNDGIFIGSKVEIGRKWMTVGPIVRKVKITVSESPHCVYSIAYSSAQPTLHNSWYHFLAFFHHLKEHMTLVKLFCYPWMNLAAIERRG